MRRIVPALSSWMYSVPTPPQYCDGMAAPVAQPALTSGASHAGSGSFV